jgi:D-alanine--poly(phosphoribitol) ligase subunit 1
MAFLRDKENFIIIDLLYKIYLKQPYSVALLFSNKEITYKKFWEDSYKFSKLILKIKKNPRVLIITNKNYFDYVALFGTLIAGGTYIPISSYLPQDRLDNIIKLSDIDIIFSEKYKNFYLKKNFIKYISHKDFSDLNYNVDKKINNYKNIKVSKFAYIIFTSGSTGNPKGVLITRKNLNSYIFWLSKNFYVKKNFYCSQISELSFDLSVAEIYGTLCFGGTLCVSDNNFEKIFFGNFLKKNKLTHLVCVPSFIDLLIKTNQIKNNNFSSIKKILFCGEPLYESHLKNIFKVNPKIKVLNTYGPTEATVSCSSIILKKNNYQKFTKFSISIGKPIPGTKFILVNNDLTVNSKFGEILIFGNQVSNGYLKIPSDNIKKFIFFNKKYCFRTGDIVEKIRSNYYFRNRLDSQIKINGYRVELDEINYHLRAIGYLKNYTLYYKDRLISFLEANQINIDKITKKLQKKLPQYMIPSLFIKLNKLPININGKVDRDKLLNVLKF